MLILLIITVFILMLLSYRIFKRDICGPSFFFSIPFLFMLMVAALNIKNWELSTFHINTFLVIFLGVLFFIIGCFILSKASVKNEVSTVVLHNNISKYHLIISFIISLTALILYVYYLLNWGSTQGTTSLSDAIYLTMFRGKFATGEETLNLPFFVNSIIICSKAFGYIYVIVLADRIVNKSKCSVLLLIVNIVCSLLLYLLSGSRGSALELIIAFVVGYLFFYYRRNKWNVRLGIKNLLLVLFGLILVCVLFFAIKGLIGRESFDWSNFYYEFCEYVGAQTKNLDIYLNSNPTRTNIFAYSTFQNGYRFLNQSFGVEGESFNILPFVFFNGKNMGNVYTCFYNYYMDFGFLGVIVFSFISGCISMYVYRKAKNDMHQINIWLVIYGYIGSCLFFCFFGNRFYSNIFDFGFVRLLVWLIIDYLFLTRFKIEFSYGKVDLLQ